MSPDTGLSRKEKKAQRDAERRGQSKKRKHAEILDSENAGISIVENADGATVQPVQNSEDGKLGAVTPIVVDADNTTKHLDPKPKKKQKTANATTDPEATTKSRFILFIGNLPYSTTDTSLQAHFQKLSPFTLRHRTDPKTRKSKGFAFLEFENYDRMKTCLKLYHHSLFDPEAKENGGSGKGSGKGGRRINVELTAGGGGKAENRKEKIKVKNTRLEEQRKRRMELESKEKAKKAKEKSTQEKESGGSKPDDRSLQQQAPSTAQDDAGGIHPSRLARIQR